jgi:hypothetical protein
MIIKAINNQFISFYDRFQLEQDYPDINFPLDFLMESNPRITDYGCYPCILLPKPLEFSEYQHNLILQVPVLKEGKWVQDWQLVNKTAEEIKWLVPIVSMAQARKALLLTNKLDTIEQAIQYLGGNAAIDWEYQTEVHRDSELVNTVALGLGWVEQEINDLFQLAITL